MAHVSVKDLTINTRDETAILFLRTITESYVHSSSMTIVEDELSDVARLTICNLEDTFNDPTITLGSVVAVKQPCWTIAACGDYHIRVDHPSDLIILKPGDPTIPLAWRRTTNVEGAKTAAEWKKEGDMMFLKKKFRKALCCYEQGRLKLIEEGNTVACIEFYRKQCGVNIILLQFDAAVEDLAQAISISAQSDPTLEDSELIDIATVKAWLRNHNVADPLHTAAQLLRPLKDLATRIKFDLGLYQQEPKYDFTAIFKYVSPLTLHVDAANYISDTEIKQTTNHGRGLFAKCDFKAGDLIMAEKAFALPAYMQNDESSVCSLYSLGDQTAADRAGALLFKELVQKLEANPSLRKEFFETDDGGYWANHGWAISEDKNSPVDVFRIEHIRRRNCFAAPMRSADVLHNPDIPVRNGFWIHTSYINHSCLPNSVRTFLGDLLLVRATRDVLAGEEITAQYVTPDLTFGNRQQKYKVTWGFECDCRLCKVDVAAGKELERQRMLLFNELRETAQSLCARPYTVTALKKFAKSLRVLEATYEEGLFDHLPKLCLVHPTLFLTEAWRTLKVVDKGMDYAKRLLRNFGVEVTVEGDEFRVMENSGLINVECVRALKYLAEGYTTKSKHEIASSITTTARTWFRIITGTDVGSEEFLRM